MPSAKRRYTVAAWVAFVAVTALPADPILHGRSLAPQNETVTRARNRNVETRRDADGRLYTRQEFLAVYNGTEEWDNASAHERRKRNRYGNARGSNRRSGGPKASTVSRLKQQARNAGDGEMRRDRDGDRRDNGNLAIRAGVPPVAPGSYRPGDPLHRASNRPQRPLVEQ